MIRIRITYRDRYTADRIDEVADESYINVQDGWLRYRTAEGQAVAINLNTVRTYTKTLIGGVV